MNDSKKKDPRHEKLLKKSGAIGLLSFNQQEHPEIQPGEVWISNCDSESVHSIGWKTKRCGCVALDRLGRPMSQNAWSGSFPVFAQKSELAKKGVFIEGEKVAIAYFPPL